VSRAATWSLLLLGGLLPAAHAAAPADCATLRLDTAGYMTYRSVEAFPNPTQTFSQELYNLTRPFAREVCGVKVTGDQTGYAFQAAQLKTLVDRLGSGLSWPLTVVGVGQSGGKPGYVDAAKIRINLPEGLMNTDVQVTGYFIGRFLPPDAVMAIRVDGGPLRPLLFEGTFRPVRFPPAKEKLELFVKSSRPVLWERMVLDLKVNRMSFTRKAAFPAR
jgi:hypothetical protein